MLPTAQYRTEAVSSVTNKILPFLTNRHLREIVTAAPSRGLDVRQVMDRQQVLIIKLSRGKLGQAFGSVDRMRLRRTINAAMS